MKDEPTWSIQCLTAGGKAGFLPQGECFQACEAICKDGNVGSLEEPLTGLSEWVPSEAIILSCLFHCGGRLSDLNGKEKWKCS